MITLHNKLCPTTKMISIPKANLFFVAAMIASPLDWIGDEAVGDCDDVPFVLKLS
jgi:hypothetical protein